MDIEKIREEFETAYVNGLVERCGEGFRSSAVYSLTEKNIDGRYKNYPDFIAWWAWQSSRAAIEVKLPKPESADGITALLMLDVRETIEAIESLGLKVKS